MKEADLKKTVIDLLQYKQNLGELVFFRLNSGDFIEVRGDTRRRIKGCMKGCADILVLRKNKYADIVYPKVLFLELKSEKGKQTLEQKEFQQLVTGDGISYYIIRSIEEVESLLKEVKGGENGQYC